MLETPREPSRNFQVGGKQPMFSEPKLLDLGLASSRGWMVDNLGLNMWVVVKIMVPFWGTLKRDHHFDNHSCGFRV